MPDTKWMEEYAPRTIRQRYAGDRNFDRLLMGSSTKPLWATAVLAVHRNLDQLLAVTGPGEKEDEVFGIPVTPGWILTHQPTSVHGGPWCDFLSYLAKSDNRYHVRLGFLGLAESSEDGTIPNGPISSSKYESLDRGRHLWMHQPRFLDNIGFNEANPRTMKNLNVTALASHLSEMYGIGISAGDVRPHRYSFWTGNEKDDRFDTVKADSMANAFFAPISPESPQFALDKIDHPRKYISLLLGGGENQWANVDFASAFVTAIQGHPVTAHIFMGI